MGRRLDDRRKSLASDPYYLALAGIVASSYLPAWGLTREDYLSAAHVGLCEAAGTFDEGRLVSFKLHSLARMHGEILDLIRKQIPCGFRRKDVVAPTILYHSAVGGDHIDDDAMPVGWEIEREDEIEAIAKLASGRQRRDMIRCLYLWADTASMTDTAKFMGLQYTRACQLRIEIREEMQYMYDEWLRRRRESA